MEISLRGEPIPTDGSGRLLITDISHHNGSISTSDEHALVYRSSKNVAEGRIHSYAGDWYLNPEIGSATSTARGSRINHDDHGWTWNRGHVNITGDLHRAVRLKRVSEAAVEGKFTCHILNDINNNKSLLILYPSE